LPELRRLPAFDRGPLLLRAFRRFAAIWRSLAIKRLHRLRSARPDPRADDQAAGLSRLGVFDLPKNFVPPVRKLHQAAIDYREISDRRTIGFDVNGRGVEIDAVQERIDLFPDLFVREPTASEIVDFSVTRVRQDQLQQFSREASLSKLTIWPL
jgi:hypothetical protein